MQAIFPNINTFSVRYILVIGCLWMSSGCSSMVALLPKNATSESTDPPRHIAVGTLNTKISRLSMGGIPEPNYPLSKQVQQDAGQTIKNQFTGELPHTKITFPVDPLQKKLEPGIPHAYLEATIHGILEMNIQRQEREYLMDYPIGPWFHSLREKGYSHLVIFYLQGAEPSTGFQTATWTEFALGLALGRITIPTTTFGIGIILIMDLKKEVISYFSTNVFHPQHWSLTDREERRALIQKLLAPYFQRQQFKRQN